MFMLYVQCKIDLHSQATLKNSNSNMADVYIYM